MPMAKSAMANEIAISANPMRMAQFTYNLVATTISDILPLAVRAGKDSRNKEVIREILAVFNNKIYQARDAYYGSITLGMIQVLNMQFIIKSSTIHIFDSEKQYYPLPQHSFSHAILPKEF
jgi:hypothetical protein